MIIGLVAGWALAFTLAVLAYRLVVSRGRLLLRVEALEERLLAEGPEPHREGLPIGAPAPAFALPDLDGHERALESWHGRRLALIFFDPGCVFCRELLPDLARLADEPGAARPLPVLVAAGDAERTRALVAEHGLDCPVLVQEEHEVAEIFRVGGTPGAYLVDEQGAVASRLALGGPDVLALARGEQAAQAEPGGTAEPAPRATALRHRPLSTSRLERHGLAAGTPAPPFTLPLVGGGEVSLDEFRGRRLLLAFVDPDCVPCDELAPRLERLHASRDDLEVLAISRGGSEANEAKIAEHRLTYPVAVQRHWDTSRAYGMFAVPIAYVIDEDGILASEVAVGPQAVLALAGGREYRRSAKSGDRQLARKGAGA